MSKPIIRPKKVRDQADYELFLQQAWGSCQMAIRQTCLDLRAFPAYLTQQDQTIIAGLTYRLLDDKSAEILSLDCSQPGLGLGSQILSHFEDQMARQGLTAIRLITTNDNLDALAFYQKRGYQLHQLFPSAVTTARQLKPSIPLTNPNGIPIRDEIELMKVLQKPQ